MRLDDCLSDGVLSTESGNHRADHYVFATSHWHRLTVSVKGIWDRDRTRTLWIILGAYCNKNFFPKNIHTIHPYTHIHLSICIHTTSINTPLIRSFLFYGRGKLSLDNLINLPHESKKWQSQNSNPGLHSLYLKVFSIFLFL